MTRSTLTRTPAQDLAGDRLLWTLISGAYWHCGGLPCWLAVRVLGGAAP